ncbi:thiamine pyrophosphate protein central region [Shewanella halifaxensis HAW-EB4]|uniref:Thiamine pyrophosphate protein central region n=1 Tax=Shewanella halifaxensis (strain HAW-EB4) TaxID=458817 RepID=B0TUB7_SHEHH|nr:thiamine pyrophosphate-binding protein [Shewanella halifaxensis]ABZ75417.1 thiamine pyrophosphate protein central region [Shewanella halifaxensis HAW-EB4]
MKRTAAWLTRYALEQLNIKHTFGIPGVHNTEIYDELAQSDSIEPILVTHEGHGAFMADAVTRSSDSMGTLLIVPAAGATHAASGIAEASLDGIAMLVISGGVRTDSKFSYQLHDMDQHKMLEAITKKTFKVTRHQDVVATLFEAYDLANDGEPGPVFVEIPVNLQLDRGEISDLPMYKAPIKSLAHAIDAQLAQAVALLANAKSPAIFVGWGGVEASDCTEQIADLLHSPVATTLQGLSAFSAKHPLHTGMGFGPAAVPAATNAFKECDCLLAIGTRFAEIATGSFGVIVPENLIHIDINPNVFNANYPAKVAIEGDAGAVLAALLQMLQQTKIRDKDAKAIKQAIKRDKQSYIDEWLAHDSGDRVNPAVFFQHLRRSLDDDALVIADDGNHTFLTAELMPCYRAKHFFSPTDFNCMGYAIPAVIGAKLANPEKQVVGIIGDGAFMMTQSELFSASSLGIGAIFTIFNDGELAQISQAQKVPYNAATCTVLPEFKFKALVEATGCRYIRLQNNDEVAEQISKAVLLSEQGIPVVLDVNIDYSKKTRFTKGIISTNLKRMNLPTKVRMISRALWRRI